MRLFDPAVLLVAILRHPTRVKAGAAVALALTMGSVALARSGEPTAAASVTVALSELEPAEGAANLDRPETAEQAKVFNAALRFESAPLKPAIPFVLAGDGEQQSRALLCLTQAVYYEAGYEPLQGRRAVAQVVLNRVRHPGFAKSICGVVFQGAATGTCQFSFVCNGALDRRPEPRAWREAELIARQALSGYVEASVGEATHYHADYVAPAWAPALAKVAAIGQHIFYRLPGGWGEPAAFSARYMGERAEITNEPEAHASAPKPGLDYRIAALLDTSAQPSALDEASGDNAQGAAGARASGK
ncbi:cell wall hydrolase [Sphingomonas sp. F9_3S_D5_B_2]